MSNINGPNSKIGMAGVPQGTSFADQQIHADSGLHPADHKFYQALALSNFYSPVDPVMYAEKATIPNNTSKVMVVWGHGDVAAISGALVEGVSPTPQNLTQFRREIPVQNYGASFLFTDEQILVGKKQTFAYGAKACGKQAKLTEIQICYGVMQGGNSRIFGGTAISTVTVAAGDVLTGDLLATALNTLIGNYAVKQSEIGKGSTNIDTKTVDSAYYIIAPFNMKTTFEGLSGTNGDKFIPVRQYASHQTIQEGEIGSYKESRIILDTAMPIKTGAGAGGIDVYAPVVFGKGAFTMAYIGPETARIITKGLGSSGTEDAADQRATQAWKIMMGGGILYEDHIMRIEVALT